MSTSTRRARTNAAPSNDWMEAGLCRQTDPAIFFPEGRGAAISIQTAEAKSVCQQCPVRSRCLDFALDTGQNTGVWGGLDEDERRVMTRRPDSTMTMCLNRQEWIEQQLAVGRSQKSIAAELGVDHGVVNRAIQRFRAEAGQEVAAA
jgi:WhiB family transcriptional regulator, redox-sensing transcriptional regulator